MDIDQTSRVFYTLAGCYFFWLSFKVIFLYAFKTPKRGIFDCFKGLVMLFDGILFGFVGLIILLDVGYGLHLVGKIKDLLMHLTEIL